MSPFYFENKECKHLQNYLESQNPNNIFVIIDENTREFCLPIVEPTLSNFKYELIEIPSGEVHKNLQTCQMVWTKMLSNNASRNSLLVNLGGGVISDLAGFVASALKRGIPFINIPTTLLATVDASHGGKTGINFRAYKNQIGLFSFPEAIFIIPDFFKSLEIRQLKTGFAEMLKHGLIADTDYWKKLKEIKDFELVSWEDLIDRSIQIKADVVKQDPKEDNIRKILNFGHTFGHAFESFSLEHHDIPLTHGEAVALGMMVEIDLSVFKLGFNRDYAREIKEYLAEVFPIRKFFLENVEELILFMIHDKKNINNDINFTLLESIGKAKYNQLCSVDEVRENLIAFINREI